VKVLPAIFMLHVTATSGESPTTVGTNVVMEVGRRQKFPIVFLKEEIDHANAGPASPLADPQRPTDPIAAA